MVVTWPGIVVGGSVVGVVVLGTVVVVVFGSVVVVVVTMVVVVVVVTGHGLVVKVNVPLTPDFVYETLAPEPLFLDFTPTIRIRT